MRLTGGWPRHWPPAQVTAAVIGLAVICSAIAFLLLVGLVAEIGAVRATAVTYVNPAVAIVAGAAFLNEAISAWTLVGFALVLAGSWLVTRRTTRPSTAQVPARSDGAALDEVLAA